jgi:hypothetical protein
MFPGERFFLLLAQACQPLPTRALCIRICRMASADRCQTPRSPGARQRVCRGESRAPVAAVDLPCPVGCLDDMEGGWRLSRSEQIVDGSDRHDVPGCGREAWVDRDQGVSLQPGDREVLGVSERVPVVLTCELPRGPA